MRLTYATTFDPKDVLAWSGSIHHMARALEAQGHEIEYLGNLGQNRLLVHKAINKIAKLSTIGELFPVERTTKMATLFADQIRAHLVKSHSDLVFSPGSIPIALLKSKQPKVFFTDATFAGILELYPEFAVYPKRYVPEGHSLEQAALDNCDLAIYASTWAARTAIEHYTVDEAKVKVVPFGANLVNVPSHAQALSAARSRNTEVLDLLFVGVSWTRKGGSVALEVARKLNRMGQRTRLHVVGCTPEVARKPIWLIDHGFISKETPEGRKHLDDLFSSSHFLILPTQAECLGIVFCEASAFALPSLANEVGGVSEAVHEGVNGFLFDLKDDPDTWVQRIAALHNDRKAYQAMCASSRAEYESRLNWNTSGAAITSLFNGLK